MPPKAFDLIVIGTGAAGGLVAKELAKAGWQVAIIDERKFGGTCALRGCSPKKIYHSATELRSRVNDLKNQGLKNQTKINWSKLFQKQKQFTDPIPQKSQQSYQQLGIKTIEGTAQFAGVDSVEVNGQIYKAKQIIIATGAKPRELTIEGNQELLTSDDFFELKELPASLLFIGAGYISLEFAQMAAQAGVKQITILQRNNRMLNQFDPDLVNLLVKSTRKQGINLVFNEEPISAVKKPTHYEVLTNNNNLYKAQLAFKTAGRVPKLDGLKLDLGKVKTTAKGVEVNSYLQSITNQRVYVSGDANSNSPALTPVANLESRLIIAKLLGQDFELEINYQNVPSAAFTNPPIAAVGLSAKEGENQGYEAVFKDTSDWFNSWRIGQEYSAAKLIIDRKHQLLKGAHLLGHTSDELINILALAIQQEIPTYKLQQFPWVYPSFSYDFKHLFAL
jgi:glutathione reductase (NADPH)